MAFKFGQAYVCFDSGIHLLWDTQYKAYIVKIKIEKKENSRNKTLFTMILPGTKTPVGELIDKTYCLWTDRWSVLDCLNPHQLLEHSPELCSVSNKK